jgi:hypothetical protein
LDLGLQIAKIAGPDFLGYRFNQAANKKFKANFIPGYFMIAQLQSSIASPRPISKKQTSSPFDVAIKPSQADSLTNKFNAEQKKYILAEEDYFFTQLDRIRQRRSEFSDDPIDNALAQLNLFKSYREGQVAKKSSFGAKLELMSDRINWMKSYISSAKTDPLYAKEVINLAELERRCKSFSKRFSGFFPKDRFKARLEAQKSQTPKPSSAVAIKTSAKSLSQK